MKVGIASPRPVRISALQEEMVGNYPVWSIRELLLNAIIHRNYQIGNAPVKFYDYHGMRLQISNPGGLYGQAKPDNFPYVNDYRNPLLAEAMKVMGYVNKFNRGIAKVKTELKENGNPPPIFDVNKQTEFRVTLRPSRFFDGSRTKPETVIPPSGEISGEIKSTGGEINGEIKSTGGEINGEIKPAVPPSGEINGEINGGIKTVIPPNGDRSGEMKIVHAIEKHPGIKRQELRRKTKIPLRTIDRILQRLTTGAEAVIEYRGSKRTGGWFIKS